MPGYPPLSTTLPEWLTVGEVAEYLRSSKDWVYRQLKDGRLAGRKVAGKWFVTVGSLRALVEREPKAS